MPFFMYHCPARGWLSLVCNELHYIDVIMTMMASQVTSLTVVYSIVYSDADQRKHQSSASLAFVWGIHRDRWIPRTKGHNPENGSIWWRHHVSADSWPDCSCSTRYVCVLPMWRPSHLNKQWPTENHISGGMSRKGLRYKLANVSQMTSSDTN